MIYDKYREVTKQTGVHVIFICQLDKKNLIKGGSELLFLSDISMNLGFYYVNKVPIKNHFTISVGSKQRYGPRGDDMTTIWEHTNNGALCLSNNRRYDEGWCKSHNLKTLSRISVPEGHLSEPVFDSLSGAYLFIPDEKKSIAK